MSKLYKYFSLIFAMMLIVMSLCLPCSASDGFSDIRSGIIGVSAQSAILLDASDNEVLFSKNASLRLPMASTTKIMTALLAAEYGNLDKSYVIPESAIGIEGSSVYLVRGEKLTLEELTYALMLQSANDAAHAIAVIIAGSTEKFAGMMNRRAAELGLKDTHFTNPHGLDDEQHYTSAYDLAKLTSYALSNSTFRKIVSTRKITIPYQNKPDMRVLVNHNRLLRSYKGAIGVKTGFTKRSGRCLVSAAERGGLTFVCVTINAPDDWRDHTSMLDWGFDSYENVMLADTEKYELALPVCGGKTGFVSCTNKTAVNAVLPKDRTKIICTAEAPKFLYAPVRKGDAVGKLIYRYEGRIVGQSCLYANEDVQIKIVRKTFFEWLKSLFGH